MVQLLCPIMIWLTLVGFFTASCLAFQDGWMKLKRLHQIPCHRCAYATGDYRLKCTVHPCQAFSELAIDCLDYEARSGNGVWMALSSRGRSLLS